MRQAGPKLHDGGTVCGEGLPQRRPCLIHTSNSYAERAERLRHGGEVRIVKIDHRRTPETGRLLGLQDAVPAVIDDQCDDVDAELDGGRKL